MNSVQLAARHVPSPTRGTILFIPGFPGVLQQNVHVILPRPVVSPAGLYRAAAYTIEMEDIPFIRFTQSRSPAAVEAHRLVVLCTSHRCA